jgi:hypothetical protein
VILLDSEFSRKQIINDFCASSNVDDLFDSDLLIIPFYKNGVWLEKSQILYINTEDNKIKIKYYGNNERIFEQKQKISFPVDIINYGSIVISTIAGLITIADVFEKKYGNKSKNIKIIFKIYILNVNGNYNSHEYNGNISNFLNDVRNIYEKEMKGEK